MLSLPRRVAACILALLAIAGLCTWSAAQTQEKYPYLATVAADDVFVRSGADFGFYGTGTLKRGDVVKVIGERSGFSRVQLVGPSFDKFYGYIILPSVQFDRFRVNPDGRSGTTLGRVEVLGPNMQEDYNPAQSWKPLARLTAEQTVIILDTTETENQTIHKVALPESSEGWISSNLLRTASADEQRAWFDAVDAAKTRGNDAAVVSAPGASATPSAEATTPVTTADATPATTPVTTANPAIASAANAASAPQPNETPDATPPIAAAPPSTPSPAPPASPSPTPSASATPSAGSTPTNVLAREEQQVPSTSAPTSSNAATPTETGGASAPASSAAAPSTDARGTELAVVDVTLIEQESAHARAAKKLADMTIEDLDAALKRMAVDDPASAEVEPLRQAYLGFAERHARDKGMAQYANTRAEQLKLWTETQHRRADIDKMRARAKLNEREAEAMVRAMNARGDYVAIGRLDASTIYDGVRLPRLYRIRDVNTGRTIGYMLADEEGFNLTTMLGTLIGVVGDTNYESGLRVDLIKPRRIDLLQPQE